MWKPRFQCVDLYEALILAIRYCSDFLFLNGVQTLSINMHYKEMVKLSLRPDFAILKAIPQVSVYAASTVCVAFEVGIWLHSLSETGFLGFCVRPLSSCNPV